VVEVQVFCESFGNTSTVVILTVLILIVHLLQRRTRPLLNLITYWKH